MKKIKDNIKKKAIKSKVSVKEYKYREVLTRDWITGELVLRRHPVQGE